MRMQYFIRKYICVKTKVQQALQKKLVSSDVRALALRALKASMQEST